jgi:hypothetical protein
MNAALTPSLFATREIANMSGDVVAVCAVSSSLGSEIAHSY